METVVREVDIESLERQPLAGSSGVGEDHHDDEDETIICSASFEDMEDSFLRYQTTLWILYSLLLILAWGIGIVMLLYAPIRRYVLRQEFRSRKLYLTPNAIIYKLTRPAAFPFLGVLKKEKHVVLPSVADIAIEQGYLQSFFGIYSMRIENVGVQRPGNDHVKIMGISNPRSFRKTVLSYLSKIKSGDLGQQNTHLQEDLTGSLSPGLSSSRSQIMQKLDEVGSSMKRVHSLIEKRHLPATLDRSRTSRSINRSE